MGMDYRYAGSASYPRFEDEICKVVEIFGGKSSDWLLQHKEECRSEPLGYWFGYLSSDETNNPKFVFPQGTNETLVKWFNNIYNEWFTAEETEEVWKEISQHPEVEEIAYQIWYELKHLIMYHEAWYVY